MNIFRFDARRALLLLLCALAFTFTPAHAAAPKDDDPDLQRVAKFQLDDQVVARYIKAQQLLAQAAKAHPELSKDSDQGGDAKSIDDAIARIDRMPVMHATLAQAGLSSSDYVLCSFALIQAGVYAAVVQMQGEKAWAKIPPGIPADNTHYVIAHKAQMDKLEAATHGG